MDTDGNQVVPTEAELAESKEWDEAAQDLFPGFSNNETTTTTTVEPTQVPDDTTTTTTTEAPSNVTTTTTTVDPNETAEQKADREKKEADALTTSTTTEEPDFSARDSRVAARENAKAVDEMATDVREKMFKDTPKVLQDADGDPITSIADVMKLQNPNTGEAFTQEEAGIWLLAAQQKFNQNIADMEKRINQIAEVNVDLKDQVEMVTYHYGELLKADEALRDKLWAQYEKTLVKDPDTGIITDMPVSLEDFYETALAPYAKLAESMENQSEQKEKDAAEAKRLADEAKQRSRQDRSDIYGGGNNVDTMDDDEKEWAAAHKAVFDPIMAAKKSGGK